jgi:hypothetical protein
VADYLTRLVERTLQIYPTVRPDIPPAFAPQTGGPMLREPQEEPAPDRHSPPRTADRGEVPEERYIVLRSTAGDTSLQASNIGESAVIEPRPASDEPPREPQEPRRRSSSAPPDPPVSDEAMEQHGRGPETSEIVPDRREATPTAFPTDIPTRRSTKAATARPEERPGDQESPSSDQPFGGPEPGRREGGFRDETAFATPPRRREAGSSRAPAVPPQDDTVPDRRDLSLRERSGRERTVVTDHPFSDTARLEEDTRTAESHSTEIDAREHPAAAPDRKEQDRSSWTSRRAVSEAPDVPTAGRQGASPLPESVAPGRPGITERTAPQTVQVTIGRVEVRAIPPVPEPARPLPESKPVPALSLDDYLRQHNGARR